MLGDEGVIGYGWGEWQLCLRRRALFRQGLEVPLSRRIYSLLLALIENRDRLLSRDELASLAWPGRRVDEATVTRTVARCRQLLLDHGDSTPCVEVRRGQGFRFSDDTVRAMRAVNLEGESGVSPDEGKDIALPWVLWSVTASGPTAEDSMPSLADSFAASLVPALRRVALSPVLARHEVLGDAAGAACEAPRVWERVGAALLLSFTLHREGQHWSAATLVTGPCGGHRQYLPLSAASLEDLALGLAQNLRSLLSAPLLAGSPLDLPDTFALEAFERARQALRQWRWPQAERMGRVLLDLAPQSLAVRALVLRALAARGAPQAIDWAESLLAQAEGRLAPEVMASIHLDLSHALAPIGDAASLQGARWHLQRAMALVEGRPPSEDAFRVRRAWARRLLLGGALDREQGRQSLLKQVSEASSRAHGPLLYAASMGRALLAQSLVVEGRIDQALPLLDSARHELRDAGMSVQVVWVQLREAECLHSLGHLPRAAQIVEEAFVAWSRLAAEDRDALSAHAACVCLLVALDRGDQAGVRAAAAAAARATAGSAHLQACQALGRAADELVRGAHLVSWEVLDRATRLAHSQGHDRLAAQLLCRWLEWALAMRDEATVQVALGRIAICMHSRELPDVEAMVARALAWQALRRGETHKAVRALSAVTRQALQTRCIHLAQLEEAWALVQLRALDRAGATLEAASAWAETTAGGIVAMALAMARGHLSLARTWLHAAKQAWRGDWPAAWHSPEDVMRSLGSVAPTQYLLAMGTTDQLARPPARSTPA